MSLDTNSLPLTAKVKLRISWVERLDNFLKTRAIRLVILALIVNTILAQAFFNSGGRILKIEGTDFTGVYLNLSSVFSTLAFSLFEVAMLWARQEVLNLDESIKTQIKADRWLRQNLFTLFVITGINFYCLTLFNAAIWPDLNIPGVPEPPAPLRFYVHAAFYSVILYLAGMVGERHKTDAELNMTMTQKHSREALQARDQQMSQQIRDMTARGESLAPLAAATASPETAQQIALQHAALSGQLSVVDAARINMVTGNVDTSLLDNIMAHLSSHAVPSVVVSVPAAVIASTLPVVASSVPAIVSVASTAAESVVIASESADDDTEPVEELAHEPGRRRLDATRVSEVLGWAGAGNADSE